MVKKLVVQSTFTLLDWDPWISGSMVYSLPPWKNWSRIKEITLFCLKKNASQCAKWLCVLKIFGGHGPWTPTATLMTRVESSRVTDSSHTITATDVANPSHAFS